MNTSKLTDEQNINMIQIPTDEKVAFKTAYLECGFHITEYTDRSNENFAFYDTSKLSRQQLYTLGRLVTCYKLG